MRFWSCFLSFVVLAAALASASPVVHKELANLSDSTASAVMASAVISANQKIHATWSDSTAPTETAVNEELQQATMLLASMPACGRNCLTGAIAASPCDLTDLTCSCGNATITEQVSVCIMGACTVKQSLTSQNATQTLCKQPVRNDSKTVSYSGVIGGVLALLAYALRMVSRMPRFGGQLGWDDAVLTVAMLEVIPLSVLSVVLADLGLGQDIWTVPFENITKILKVYYFDEDLYLTCLPLVKISMLLFYLRIFPQRWFRIACFVAMAACVGYAVAFLLVSVFQCRPIPMAWENWHGEMRGVCNDINAQGWTSAAINVVLDIVVLGLPLPVIAKLQLNKRKKFLFSLMFCVGFLVTIISILRLQVLASFGGSNFTWGYRAVGYWSTTETDLAIICACMPGIRALIMTVWPRVMGGTTRGKSPMPSSFGASGAFDNKHSQPTTRSGLGTDKDWIPLVETVAVPTKDMDSFPDLPPSAKTAEMGEIGVARTGTWNEPASWESSRAPRRATLERRNSAGGKWKISMDGARL